MRRQCSICGELGAGRLRQSERVDGIDEWVHAACWRDESPPDMTAGQRAAAERTAAAIGETIPDWLR